MQEYIGVKIVYAAPMTRGEYNEYRHWTLPADENADDPGYLIEYPSEPGQKSNHPPHDGYVSWCPKDVFETHNRPTDGMTFGMAIEAAKLGHKISRRGWNGHDMFVVYMPEMHLPPYNCQEPGKKVNDRTAKFIGPDAPLDCQPYFAMYNAQRQWIPGWLASQSDMLADDWYIVE